MTHEEQSVGEPMAIVECGLPRRPVVEWVGQEDRRVEIDLGSHDGRTVLRFRQFFAAGTEVAEFASGRHWYLDRLDAVVEGRSEPADRESSLATTGVRSTA